MNAADFRRLALLLEGAEEGSHMGAADFRVGGKIFATLASQDQGYGNLMLSPEQQAAYLRRPARLVFACCRWLGPNGGHPHPPRSWPSEDVLAGALRTAWKLRVEKNAKAGSRKSKSASPASAAKSKKKKSGLR